MKRILVIDDNEDTRELAQLSLELHNDWQVLMAPSGSEGLAKALSNQPDAILLDVMMPNMDGSATLHELRSHPTTRDIPVILLTAKVQSTEHHLLAHLGAAAVIVKPFDPLNLAKQVANALGWDKKGN
ncbi:MAG: response regulator [Cyanobacteria bacterium NC_groundwater_1444_Ag_S-0.65um_54_12]|nr:response regulator [Cyanobacteria bacterium NC_groundwater_1444_Ag_S-0.65um_54_12]